MYSKRTPSYCRWLQGLLTIVVDFLTKVSGKADMREELYSTFPVVPLSASATSRILGLNCLTQDYVVLWNDPDLPRGGLGWSKSDPRLDDSWFDHLNQPWQWDSPLRSDYSRWQAHIELDVLFAQACGLTLEQLITIYRMQFPVLQTYEQDIWYDRQGRVVFSCKSGEGIMPRTCNRRDTCYSLQTPQENRSNIALGWNDVKDFTEGVVSYTFTDDTLPGGP